MPLKFKQLLFIAMALVIFKACKKETTDPAPVNTTKTLNKSTMSPKKWYSEGSSTIHDLQAGGVYGTQGGDWKWKNNSDTLEIVIKSGFPTTYWKVYWNTDTEMECENVANSVKLLYKDHAW